MGLITAVRSPLPVAATSAHLATDPVARVPIAETARPVAATERQDAPQQPAATVASVTVRLAERDESDHPAVEARRAAEAAREAYIQASRAAGLNPMPLPGA